MGRSQGVVVTIIHSFLQQFLSRLLPFFFNLAVRSRLTPEDAAVSSVYIPLLYAIIQGVCREGVRRGCLRAPSLSAANVTARAFIPWSVIISTASVLLFSWRVPENADGNPQPGYAAAMKLVWLALFADAFIEPLYIRGVYKGETRFEMQVEVAARTAEAFIVWLTVTTSQLHHSPSVSFAAGALTYSTVVGIAYVTKALTSYREPIHIVHMKSKVADDQESKSTVKSPWPAMEDLSVCALFTWQGAQKMLLQEASRIALSTYSARATGIYGEVQNLGSVVVRMVFWPVENAAFRSFSDTAAADEKENQPSQRHWHLPQLQLLVKAVLLAALLACAFGPNYAFAAIHVLLSHSWSSTEAPTVLAAYTAFLLCIAINGVLEAYIHARMSPKELMLSNGVMIAIVMLQAGGIAASKQLGESCVSLVAIDCFSMLLRIVTALWYMSTWHRHYSGPKLAWMPSLGTVVVLAGAAFVTWLSNQRMISNLGDQDLQHRLPRALLEHVAIGVAVLGCVFLSWLRFESDALRSLRPSRREHED
eukprot:jgi/Ulvmu1/11270/UM073_0042.1